MELLKKYKEEKRRELERRNLMIRCANLAIGVLVTFMGIYAIMLTLMGIAIRRAP